MSSVFSEARLNYPEQIEAVKISSYPTRRGLWTHVKNSRICFENSIVTTLKSSNTDQTSPLRAAFLATSNAGMHPNI